ncbi:MAG: DNA-binding protein [Candidatus Sungbacteria bacterium]|uniref:DNA-binding protein n=1 Tax=Candidatus Sungiibacteriota bacterium TaxID=2750080 RepID=A0A931SC54_9BACT|nr:DNA-binding protein [Candidatus Sungbacteria bacterium]
MRVIHQANNTHVLAWNRGEEVLSGLREYLVSENIRAGHLAGLGAAESLEIAFYNLETKEYEKRATNYDVEILSLVGNVAMLEGQPIIHLHGVFAKRDFSAFGGHIFRIVVAGACEIHLTVLDGLMQREYDEATGLNLLCGVN